MQVGFSNFEYRVVTGAVFASSTLPALALMADLPGGHDMFPFDTCCAVGIFAWDITAGCEVDAVPGVFAATVKLGGLGGVEFPGDFFGFTEGLGCTRVCAGDDAEAGQCQ